MYTVVSFNGLHNRTKAKVLIFLLYLSENGARQGITINQLANLTGLPISSLRALLPKWWRWGYVNMIKLGKAKPDGSTCLYRIGLKGRNYVQLTIPTTVYNECIQDIQDWQREAGLLK